MLYDKLLSIAHTLEANGIGKEAVEEANYYFFPGKSEKLLPKQTSDPTFWTANFELPNPSGTMIEDYESLVFLRDVTPPAKGINAPRLFCEIRQLPRNLKRLEKLVRMAAWPLDKGSKLAAYREASTVCIGQISEVHFQSNEEEFTLVGRMEKVLVVGRRDILVMH
jgi:hypothetical protein